MAASKPALRSIIARLCAGLFIGCVLHAEAAAPTALDSACRTLSKRLASVDLDACLRSGLQVVPAVTVKGRPMLLRDYQSLSATRLAPPRVLLIGGIHGDELTAVSVVMQWMQKLRDDHQTPFQWRVIPCANPDGLFAQPASTRVNARGVDLNRNFPTPDWQARAQSYWVQQTAKDPRRYPGLGPQSEPETRWLVAQIAAFHPDAIISVHAPFGVLDYDGPPKPPPRFGYLNLHQLGTYPGSLGNFISASLRLPVITLELPHSGIMPSTLQTERIWTDMNTWLQQNLPAMRATALQRAQK